MNVATAEQVREIERRAVEQGVSERDLMERAGHAAADCAARIRGGARYQRVVVLVGPGNNGGDGLVAARYLHDAGAWVRCVLPLPREDDANLAAVRERNIPVLMPDQHGLFDDADLVIDALLGTGRARPIEGPIAMLLDCLRDVRQQSYRPSLLALDLPTGVNADTGAADLHTVPADQTITFGISKVGLHVWPGSERAGEVEVADIGLPADLVWGLPFSLITPEWVRSALPPRSPDANKGTFGRVMVAAGSRRYVGAAALSTASALRTGAGLVTLACTDAVQRMLAGAILESTFLPLPDEDGVLGATAATQLLAEIDGYDALLMGPGLSQTAATEQFVIAVLDALKPGAVRAIVIDADALNNLAKVQGWHRYVHIPAVLTPHPGEMARLLGTTVPDVQAGRLDEALRAARLWGQVVVLKGANTVVVAPDGRARISAVATPALATAGTGDILAGAIASLIGQGMTPFDAAAAAVWLHAEAGRRIARSRGLRGAIAGDLLEDLPQTLAVLESGEEL